MFKNLVIKAEMTADRTLDSILAEYGATLADIEIEGNYVTIYTSSKREERLTPPKNGDLWVLWDDSGYYVTNDKKGKFFKYYINTEDNELCLNEEQTVSLLKERISEMDVPDTKYDLRDMALSTLAKPGSNLEDVNDFLDSMIEDDLDTRGIIFISKIESTKSR